jgi:hypothetical protein
MGKFSKLISRLAASLPWRKQHSFVLKKAQRLNGIMSSFSKDKFSFLILKPTSSKSGISSHLKPWMWLWKSDSKDFSHP